MLFALISEVWAFNCPTKLEIQQPFGLSYQLIGILIHLLKHPAPALAGIGNLGEV